LTEIFFVYIYHKNTWVGPPLMRSPNEPSQKSQERERIGESRKRAKARETEMAAARGRGADTVLHSSKAESGSKATDAA
jgi:hypothetical protein